MSHIPIHHPVNSIDGPLESVIYDSMFQIFNHICSFWGNLDEPELYRSRLYTFMDNRMKLRPEYRQYYQLAHQTMKQQIALLGETKAYENLFTNPDLIVQHCNKALSVTRQKVSNEFITFQLDQGGFKVFGAKNDTGYISGAYIPNNAIPYRTLEN